MEVFCNIINVVLLSRTVSLMRPCEVKLLISLKKSFTGPIFLIVVFVYFGIFYIIMYITLLYLFSTLTYHLNVLSDASHNNNKSSAFIKSHRAGTCLI